MAEKTENTKNRLTGMLLSKNRRAQYLRLFAVLAACVAVVVAVVLHQNGVAMTHEEKVLTCPVEGVVAHTHNESCYDADGNLVCTLPERALHTHSDGCYTEKRELTCGLEESEGHKHTDACYDANTGALTCGKEESEGHKHTDACYTVTRELTCGQEEITEEHVHGPGCFTTVQVKNNEPAANAMPAQNFTGELKDQDDKVVLKVEVEAPEGAFPANTTMEIKALDSNDVKGAVDEAVAQKTKDKVAEVQAVDIKFFNETGQEIEPAVDITVRFVSNVIAQNDNSYVVHVNKDGKGDVVDSLTDEQLAERNQKAGDNELYVDAKEFSPYVLVGTKALTTDVLMADGNQYTVTVTYGEDAKIPEGATLKVTPFASDSEEYKNARNAVIADMQVKGVDLDPNALGLAAMDISILDASGKKIEPSAAVTVDMKIKELPEVKNVNDVKDSLAIQHHVETGDGVVVETVFGGNTEGKFEMATNDEVIKNGTAVNPNAVKENNNSESVDTTFTTEVFSTFTISWRLSGNRWDGYYWGRSITVHYVDQDGNDLTISNPGNTHTNLDTTSSSPAFLIYDIDGYEYDYTYHNNNKNSKIAPLLTKNDNNRWQYMGANDTNKTEFNNGDNVYVVYKKKAAATTGGKPTPTNNGTWPEGTNAPQFTKSSLNNGTDGTNTVALSIKAAEQQATEKSKADVIVVFDKSGSMKNGFGHNTTRLQQAKAAVNNMANTLLNGQGNDVRMALVPFSTTVTSTEIQGFTKNYNTFKGKVDNLSADGGTNWEQALQIANQMAVESDRATFIVFVTDGDPTFRISRGDVANNNLDMWSNTTYEYYRNNKVFGEGDDDSKGRNLAFAKQQVSAIKDAKKEFYAIGISNDVQKVQDLTTGGGVAADHAFIASDNAAMQEAFTKITNSITSMLGFGDVHISDGITELANTEMEVMQEVDPNSFTYYRWGGEGNKYGSDYSHKTEWQTREQDGCAAASYNKSDGVVQWNMGEGFQLENGVNYIVTFRVWPSQEAYDLIADLNNGIKVYESGHENSISEDQRKQVVQIAAPTSTTAGSYTLKTNTDTVNATYKKTSKTGTAVTISSTENISATYTEGTIQNMPLESMRLTIKKMFEDELTAKENGVGEDRPTTVTLRLKRRDAYTGGRVDGEYKTKNENGKFTDYEVPQKTGRSADIVLNDQNDWTFSVYIAPGFINNNKVLEHGYDFTVTEPGLDYHYDLIEEVVNPMVVDGVDTYIGGGEDQSLTAINRVKSGIDVKKIVVDSNGKEITSGSAEFTITGKLLGPDGQPYTWKEGDDKDASGAYHKYDANGNRIVYKGHFADSSNIEFKLKAGEYVRFINVPQGCTFEFSEVRDNLEDQGYEWKSTTAVTEHKAGDGFSSENEVQPVVENGTAKLTTGVVGDKQYSVTFTNKQIAELPTVNLQKLDAKTNNPLSGSKFSFTKLDKSTNEYAKITDVSPNGTDATVSLGALSPMQYRLEESEAPQGYIIQDNKFVYFKVELDETNPQKPQYVVKLTDQNGTVLGDNALSYATLTKDSATNTYTIKIKNTPGEELPATGGIGTTAIYVTGAVIVGIAAYGLASKKLRNNL